MTSRERVRLALNHQEPDRVPVDTGASRVTGISAVAYRHLLRHLGREEDIRVYDLKQQLAAPSLAVIDRLGGDVVQLHRLAPTSGMAFLALDEWKAGRLTDGSPCLVPRACEEIRRSGAEIELVSGGELYARRSVESLYFDVCWTPLAHAETRADIDRFVWPDPWTEREEQYVRGQIDRWFHGTDKALFAGLPMFVCYFLVVTIVSRSIVTVRCVLTVAKHYGLSYKQFRA